MVTVKWAVARSTLALMLLGGFPAGLFGQLPMTPVSQEFVEAFVVTERAKLIDKIQKQADQFDSPRELEKFQQKHMKVFGTPVSVNMLAEFDRIAHETPASPQNRLDPSDPAYKRSPTELSPELFLANAKVKFMEDIREEGARFDTPKEMTKLTERFERNFGMSMPRDLQDVVLRSADDARIIIAKQREETVGLINDAKNAKSQQNAKLANSTTRKTAPGTRSPDKLPDWFSELDRDRDGQIGLYEWDRRRFAEFTKWDLNGDGFVEPREAQRVSRPTSTTANKEAKVSNRK